MSTGAEYERSRAAEKRGDARQSSRAAHQLACLKPRRRHSAAPSRVDQNLAIGMAAELSVTTRLEDSLSLSRVDQHVAIIGMATERSVTTWLKDLSRVH